jgi:hypothetical protein
MKNLKYQIERNEKTKLFTIVCKGTRVSITGFLSIDAACLYMTLKHKAYKLNKVSY